MNGKHVFSHAFAKSTNSDHLEHPVQKHFKTDSEFAGPRNKQQLFSVKKIYIIEVFLPIDKSNQI